MSRRELIERLAVELIRQFEGVSLTAYQDSGGVWTIGWGHTTGVKPGMTITLEQAEGLLKKDLTPLLDLVEAAGIPAAAAAALVSFGYNAGRTRLMRAMQMLPEEAAAYMSQIVRDRKGNVLRGLVRRRGLETALLLAGMENYDTVRSA
jgi:GH24 family phage-related lysozyme (muramidase)